MSSTRITTTLGRGGAAGAAHATAVATQATAAAGQVSRRAINRMTGSSE